MKKKSENNDKKDKCVSVDDVRRAHSSINDLIIKLDADELSSSVNFNKIELKKNLNIVIGIINTYLTFIFELNRAKSSVKKLKHLLFGKSSEKSIHTKPASNDNPANGTNNNPDKKKNNLTGEPNQLPSDEDDAEVQDDLPNDGQSEVPPKATSTSMSTPLSPIGDRTVAPL